MAKLPRFFRMPKQVGNAMSGFGGGMKFNAKVIVKFDPKLLKQRLKYKMNSALQKAALYIRKVAIRLIRKARPGKTFNKPSKAGQPYKARPHHGNYPSRRILAEVVNFETAAYIGTIGNRKEPAPSTQEFGKTVAIKTRTNKYGRRRGKYSKNNTPGMSRYKINALNKRRNAYKARKQSMKMVEVRRTVNYPKRPVMKPALDKSLSRLPPIWAGSLRGF